MNANDILGISLAVVLIVLCATTVCKLAGLGMKTNVYFTRAILCAVLGGMLAYALVILGEYFWRNGRF